MQEPFQVHGFDWLLLRVVLGSGITRATASELVPQTVHVGSHELPVRMDHSLRGLSHHQPIAKIETDPYIRIAYVSKSVSRE